MSVCLPAYVCVTFPIRGKSFCLKLIESVACETVNIKKIPKVN